jgi:hypothetical protein
MKFTSSFSISKNGHHWKLKVNLQKTKVIIFCKRKSKNQLIFKLCGENLQIEDFYSYLGVIFNYNGSFVKAMGLCIMYKIKDCKFLE